MMYRSLFATGLALVAFSLVACGGKSGAEPQAAPSPAPPAVTDTPGDDLSDLAYEAPPPSAKERLENLNEDSAREVLAEMEASWPLDPEHPLASPQTLEDVEQILQLDQVNLYPGAIAIVEGSPEFDAMALHAQIELAWGETYTLLSEILAEVLAGLKSSASKLEQRGAAAALDAEGEARLEWMRGSQDELALRVEALRMVAVDHLAIGIDRAERLIEQHPDNYLGYRVACDYYRILREWEQFDAMLEKLVALNPDSNGLRFQRAASIFQRERNLKEAEKWYRQALAKDPHFVRAQVHLLVIQSDIERTHAELLALEKLNPHHPFVAIAGEAIKKAYEASQTKSALTN